MSNPVTSGSGASSPESNGPAPIEAIDRALSLLTGLAGAGPEGATLADLGRDLGLNKSTAYRALATMRSRGFVTQDAGGSYRLGPEAIGLGAGYFGPASLTQQLRPALLVLARNLDELVHLGVLNGDQVIYVDKVEPDKSIRVWSQVGRHVPAANTSLGRAILAYRPIPDDHLEVFAHSDAESAGLRKAVVQARERGYATEIEENEPGIACLGVPVLFEGAAVAALSVTMLATTFGAERMDEVAATIAELVPPRLPENFELPAQLRASA
ncbi:IclR family transcriptional regulator [Propionimicrobium sp. PCR01-08-3]|uniref:IclR family transcriptional regulator n=1 Tax=Propionimicrobium sp. PCR01-08-3 TaxID=3052086 RepID=UPI00255C7D18|nr:IclR family transcriptional regulator [Propionimicrobium sp. PCR01-08-3]WIY82775.1 IclR family transcriptional regulator [Propionimicrobium sp. PCR01-08-3]